MMSYTTGPDGTKYYPDGTHFGSALENAYATSAHKEALKASTLERSQLNIIYNLGVAAQSHFESEGTHHRAHDIGLLLGIVKAELEKRR